MSELMNSRIHNQSEEIDLALEQYVIESRLNLTDGEDVIELLLRRGGAGERAEGLAKALIDQFGSIVQVVNAPRDQLRTVTGISTAMIDEIMLFQASVLCVLRAESMAGPVEHTWNTLKTYCEYRMLNSTAEALILIYLDKGLRIKKEELHQRGTVDTVGMYETDIVRNALSFGASAILFVRLRPFNRATVSKSYEKRFAKFAECLSSFGIEIYDHIVVSPGETRSLLRGDCLQNREGVVSAAHGEEPGDPATSPCDHPAARIVAFPLPKTTPRGNKRDQRIRA